MLPDITIDDDEILNSHDVLSLFTNTPINKFLEVIKERLTTDNSRKDRTQFTSDQEQDEQIPFLDTLIMRKADGHAKLLVYRKKTHTDQYLHFSSHHPLQHGQVFSYCE